MESEEELKKKLKDVKYNTNSKVKCVEKRMDDLKGYIESTMETYATLLREICSNQKRIEERLISLEKEIKTTRNRRVIQEERQIRSRKKIISESISSPVLMNDEYHIVAEEDMESMEDGSVGLNIDSPKQLVRTNSVQYMEEKEKQQMIVSRRRGGGELNTTYRDLKLEIFDIPVDFVKKCLEMNSMGGDIKLFKKMYIDGVPKEYLPIRHIRKKFQYWLNGHMNDDDTNGSYIKDTITRNIESLYLKINMYENYQSNNIDQFVNNQDHINKLSDEKYKEKLLIQIIPMIDL
jgi:hypothetical protein